MAISPYWVSNNTVNGVPVINIRPSKDAGDALYQAYTKLLTMKGIGNEYVVIDGAGHGFDPRRQMAGGCRQQRCLPQIQGLVKHT